MATNISKEKIEEEIEQNWKKIPQDEKLPIQQQMLINFSERLKGLELAITTISERLSKIEDALKISKV